MADLLDGYELAAPLGQPAWDEMFASPGVPRPTYQALFDSLSSLSSADFDRRAAARDRSFRDQGITFSLDGEERPFPLDLIPRIITAGEWRTIEAGVTQRVRALEMFLDDIYGTGRVFDDGIVPRRLITSSKHFHRQAVGIRPPNGVRVHVSGIDLVRDAAGDFRVLEDNLRTPSGVSYVVENRRAMTRVFPELFSSHRVRPVSGYPARLLEALQAAAPHAARSNPTVVVLTPGIHNSAYFEHSFLARQMGVELVEGRDLVCRDRVVSMRTTQGEQRVDVIYRRIDDDFLDPLQFRPDSLLGCPDLLNAARAGNVTIANMVGNGVADDKLIYTYVPALIDYYLGERPLLSNVETLRLEDPDQLRSALDRLDQLVLKPVDASGGYGIVIGPKATDEELATARATLLADPRDWIAQEPVTLSTSPTRAGEKVRGRHIDLRPFAVNDGEKIWVQPGGLTRVALVEGNLVVNSSQGGGSKDTWVLADPIGDPAEVEETGEETVGPITTSMPAISVDAAMTQSQSQASA
jgi:uncharacterized circularly permuted ATP-grasp superfamily protein